MKLENINDFYDVLIEHKPVNDMGKTIWRGLATSFLMQLNNIAISRDLNLSELVKLNHIHDLASEYEVLIPYEGVFINQKLLRDNGNKNSDIEAYFEKRSNT